MIYYFAYGSNLHPMRLLERVASAKFLFSTKLLKHKLTFHKKSIDGSSKCNLLETDDLSDFVYGAIYELKEEHKKYLDSAEGKGKGYIESQIKINYEGEVYDCFIYLAQQAYITESLKPYHWYKEMVVLGAKYLKFPDTYISAISDVDSSADLDKHRNQERYDLIEEIRSY